MANMFVVAYPDVATATKVRNLVIDLQKQQLIVLQDIVVAERKPDGKIKLHQMASTTGAGAAGGALWGGLIGLIFFMPLLGMAVGAATGAAAGSAADYGIDDNFMKQLSAELKPGAAAVFALVESSTRDKVIEALQPYGGQLIHTSLSKEQEEHLQAALAGQRA
ncbi:DUF1269 domain-containing protein [Streptosporangiaceae bacterium NEAU-GS5]|nr:DUF1269 domain-containing protein [Streptosporangiaceae bacterium NEAU-GS5]